MIDAQGLRKGYGAQQVLDGASFRIAAGERLALVGPNGSGKTTLLRLLSGLEASDGGDLSRPRDLEVGYLPQEIDVRSDLTLLPYVEDVAEDLRRTERELHRLAARMEAGGSDPELLQRYGHLQTRFEHLDGYTLRARAQRILAGLGFSETDFRRPVGEFSGGWRMRAALGRILLREPDLILLDEPTNHLDIVSLEWIEEHIRESSGAYLIVSHDVAFLDRVVQGVLALEAGKVLRTTGNYAAYQRDRELRREQSRAAHENYRKRRAAEEQFVERFRYKATKARQVQSRLRRMEKEEPPPSPPENPSVMSLSLPQPERCGRTVVSLQGVRLGYGSTAVHRHLDLRIDRAEKLALIGPNGAGKSTLLKALAGVIEPLRGRVEFGHNVRVSYFAQHQLEQLDPRRTALEEMARVPTLSSETEMRSILGAFLFSGDAVDKPVAVLSGGEKSRLVLAKLFADPGNLLLMDEPTNHLDIQACEVLKQALEGYQGTLVLITHDRDLINRVADRVLYLDGSDVSVYLGNYDAFLARRRAELEVQEVERPDRSEGARGVRKEQRRREAERRQRVRTETGPLRDRVANLEGELERKESRFESLENELADPATYGDPERAGRLAKERARLEEEIERITEDWESAMLTLEERERQLRAEWGEGEGEAVG